MKKLPLLAALLVLPLLGSNSPKEYDGVMTADSLEGTWRLYEIIIDGLKVSRKDSKYLTTYRRGTYTSIDSDGDTIRGSYRTVSTRMRQYLDDIPSNGPFEGHETRRIYQLNGDTLRIASGEPRLNQGFNDGGVIVLVYKRVK